MGALGAKDVPGALTEWEPRGSGWGGSEMPRAGRLVVAAVLAMLALAGAAQAGARMPHFHHALAKSRVLRDAQANRVIVVLKSQHAGGSPRRRASGRGEPPARERRPLIARVTRSGGAVTRQFTVLNAFAARSRRAERGPRSRPAVAAVVPDALVTLPAQAIAQTGGGAAAPSPGNPTTPQSAICPSDPAKPLLEPEALQTMHVAYKDPTTPQAQNLATGRGVKVAFFADGLDINNPDFIRPDGSHVFIDYRDFTGEGPNAPTGAAEAFGDASSIAAQGRQVYDLSNFVNPAHPLPPGCTITVRGMAPGASLIGMKVFGAGVGVLLGDHPGHGLGRHPRPRRHHQRVVRRPYDAGHRAGHDQQFNDAAVAAGVTVSQGTATAARRRPRRPRRPTRWCSTRGATRTSGTTPRPRRTLPVLERHVAERQHLVDRRRRLRPERPVGGLRHTRRGQLGAVHAQPGDLRGVHRLQGQPRPGRAAPLSAVRRHEPVHAVHRGRRGAHDRGLPQHPPGAHARTGAGQADPAEHRQRPRLPAREQGAGEVDALKAVQEAMSVNGGTPTGHGLLFDPAKLTIVGRPGRPTTRPSPVTNTGATTQTVSAHGRALTTQVSDEKQDVNLSIAADVHRPVRVAAAVRHDDVHRAGQRRPAGRVRRLAGPERPRRPHADRPDRRYAAYTRPQGDGDHTQVDVRNPVAGTWTAIVFLRDGTFTGRSTCSSPRSASAASTTSAPST